MRKLAVIHFNSIEAYPPVMNWLNYLADRSGPALQVRVYTMAPASGIKRFVPASPNIRIIRAGRQGQRQAWVRYLQYLLFYARTFLGLIGSRPGILLYYESISSLPALLYKKYFGRKARLFIHYHEYTSIPEYEQGMSLTRYLHRMEKRQYASADWLSQTNDDRIACFTRDLQGVSLPVLRVLPNYPPASWKRPTRNGRAAGGPLRIVYIGALSLDTMYTREFAQWVRRQQGEVIWDIYTNNLSPDSLAFLRAEGESFIRFRGATDYFSLPEVLKDYDVGIILYKGHIPNYVYNAPNKLFEYLACGLDVWFPDTLRGSYPYVTSGTYPRVMSLDFGALDGFSWQKATDREGLSLRNPTWYCEDVLVALWREMTDGPEARSPHK